MGISGLDSWLTTPPEQEDWIEIAEKISDSWQSQNEREATMIACIDGLLEILDNEGVHCKKYPGTTGEL